MKVPGHILDEIRNRISISTVVGRSVAWDRRKSNPGKGDYWGLCPFHTEKSPSFHADDRKGMWHCFGCKASGDIFTFLVEKEGLTFPDAVQRLAEEAGVKLPEPSREERHKAQVRATLHDVMIHADAFFQERLRSPVGHAARDYINARQIPADMVRGFGIGYAPNDRHGLRNHLAGLGISVEQMLEAGLLVAVEGDALPFDRFRDRVMFPIRDARGRVIAFGGRALSADARARYLNSPETPIFVKGRELYNFDRARPIAHKTGALAVVEGYIDVIAMTRAGIAQTVAPMGTALTPEQLSLLWRTVPEPVLCFDGDSAGTNAAHRAMDMAVPILSPGHSLRFCFLPAKMDPDDVLRQHGAEALREILQGAVSLSDALWSRALLANDRSTPERAAQFEKDLTLAVDRIGDGTVRGHYRQDLRQRLQQMFAPPAARYERRSSQAKESWRVGQPATALLGSLAAMEKATAAANQLRGEGCSDELD